MNSNNSSFSISFLLPITWTAKAPAAFSIKETRSKAKPCVTHGAVKAKNASPAPIVSRTYVENIGILFISLFLQIPMDSFFPNVTMM